MVVMLWMMLLLLSGRPTLVNSLSVTRLGSLTRLGFLMLTLEGTIGKYLNLTREGLDEHEQRRLVRKLSKQNRTRRGIPGGMAADSVNDRVVFNSSLNVDTSARGAAVAAATVGKEKDKSKMAAEVGMMPTLSGPKITAIRPAAPSLPQLQRAGTTKNLPSPSAHQVPTMAPSYPPVHQIESRCTEHVDDAAHRITVFWVNMEKSTARRQYYSAQMQAMGLKNKRIEAATPDSIVIKEVKVDIEPKIPHTPKEISCVVSHLIAMREAIYDKTLGPNNPFALITEDDVSFEMNVNFRALVASAPKPFVGLQLMSSADNEMKRMWQDYKKNPVTTNLWEQRKLESFFWSAQAYVINKTALKPLIDQIFSFKDGGVNGVNGGSGGTGKDVAGSTTEASYDNLRVRIINPPNAYPGCAKGTKCYFPMRLVSDTYIYSLCYPTYVTKIPLFNGHRVGGNTTIHMRKVNDIAHAKAFSEIAKLLAEVRKSSILPPHISPKKCDLV